MLELEERCSLPGMQGIDARRKARRLAMRLGVPAPEACAKRCATHTSRPAVARVKRQPAPVAVDTAPAVQVAAAPPSVPTIDPALSAWRKANLGSVIQIRPGAIVLHRLDAPPLHFASMAEAVASVTTAA
jgi:hypothetical protein